MMLCDGCHKYKTKGEFRITPTASCNLCKRCVGKMMRKYAPKDWEILKLSGNEITIRAKKRGRRAND